MRHVWHMAECPLPLLPNVEMTDAAAAVEVSELRGNRKFRASELVTPSFLPLTLLFYTFNESNEW